MTKPAKANIHTKSKPKPMTPVQKARIIFDRQYDRFEDFLAALDHARLRFADKNKPGRPFELR